MVSLISTGLQRLLTRSLNDATSQVSKSLYRLGTGKRVNGPEDGILSYNHLKDLQGQARGLSAAYNNVSDVNALAEKAQSTLTDMLQMAYDVRELAQQGTDGGLTDDEREALQDQIDQIVGQMQNAANSASYNSFNLLDGSFGTKTVQAGINSSSSWSFSIGDARTSTLGKLMITSGSVAVNSTGFSGSNYLKFNGYQIGGSADDNVSTASADASALAKANAINDASDTTGVYAESFNYQTLYFSTGTFGGTLAGDVFKINNVQITGTGITSAGDLADAINQSSQSTGVIASIDSSGNIQLYAEDGRNIQLVVSTGGFTYNFWDAVNLSQNSSVLSAYASLSAGGNTTTFGKIQIWSSDRVAVETTATATSGIAAGIYNTSGGTAVQYVQVDSEANAQQAVKVLDATITQISRLQANVGAVHGRLSSNADKLVQDLTNNDNAQTDIGGVDFAVETANLVYNQLLQNSSLASLIQANLSRVTVAKLLGDLD